MLRRYRLRIFDGQYEVLHKSSFYVRVDLDSPTAEEILGRQFAALIDLARRANEPMDRPVMKVCDWETDKVVMEVVA
jgi:hypothetical protein